MRGSPGHDYHQRSGAVVRKIVAAQGEELWSYGIKAIDGG
jgi:hypothetical protein